MEKEITTVLERRVIPEVTAATKNAIKRKTAFNLPDRPSDMGMKPSEIKKAFWSPVIDDEHSVLSELERVIHDINVAFDELVYPPFEDGEGKNAGVQDAENPNRAIGDGTLALGNGTVAGSRAYRIKDYDSTVRRYYLDVAANDDAWFEGIEVGVDCYSIYWRFRRTKFGKITFAGNEDGKACIDVDNFFEPGVSEAEKQEYLAEAYIYIVGKPHLGTVTIGATAVSSGIGTVAAESETDAGGRNTVSDGRFAFSRGYGNVTGYCGASFGQDNENLGLKGFAGGGQGNYIGPTVERAAVFNFLNAILANNGAAFGQNNKVDVGGVRGFVAGLGNVVNRANQAKFGKYSPTDTSALWSVGNGTSDTARKMAFGVWEDGHAEVQSVGDSPKSVVHKKYVAESCNTAESKAKTYADGTGDYSTNGFVPIQPDKTSLKKGSGYSAYVLFGDSNNLDANGEPVQTPQLKAISRRGIGSALAQYGSNGRLSDNGAASFAAYGNAELPNKKAIADYLNDGTAGYLKTVKDEVAVGINAFATEVTDNGAVDKFAELVSYVSKHGGEAANMAEAITTLQNNKADNTHNHDGVYSPVGHNHDDIYSKPGHTHNYAEKNGTYSAMTVGKATTAALAGADSEGNVIHETYATKAELSKIIVGDVPLATTSNPGLMSTSDKIKVDKLPYDAPSEWREEIAISHEVEKAGGTQGLEYSIGVSGDNEISAVMVRGKGGVWWNADIVIPDELFGIPVTFAEAAFQNAKNIKSIKLPGKLEYIAPNLFNVCIKLSEITIPETVTWIGTGAFRHCIGLKSIVLPAACSSIGEIAFYGCEGLESVTWGESGIRVGGNAFEGCDNLNGVYISNLCAWCSSSFETDTANPRYFTDNFYLNGKELDGRIEIPGSPSEIPKYTFKNCDKITKIYIPKSVWFFGDYAFEGCTALKDVYFEGTASEWNIINKGVGNECVTNATIHYNFSPTV